MSTNDSEFLAQQTTLHLLDEVRAGNEVAVSLLYKRHLARLQRWARGRLPRGAREMMDTDDLVQQVLMKTLRHVDSFESAQTGGFQSYLRAGVTNLIRDELRRRQRQPHGDQTASSVEAFGSSPLEEFVGREKLDRYERGLSQLTESDREIVVARLELGLSFDEIAKELGKPSADAARMAVTRAVTRLAEEVCPASTTFPGQRQLEFPVTYPSSSIT